MKQIIPIVLLILLCVTACKKEKIVQETKMDFLSNLKSGLMNHLTQEDFDQIDFNTIVNTTENEGSIFFSRLTFKGSNMTREFLLVKTTSNGTIVTGKIINLQLPITGQTINNGYISISSLSRNKITQSPIVNGFIVALHPIVSSKTAGSNLKMPDPIFQPDFLYFPDDKTHDHIFQDGLTMKLASVFDAEEGGGGDGGYGDGGSSTYTPLAGGGGSGAPAASVEIEDEYIYNEQPVNLQHMFNCFDILPDNSTYAILLSADVPSNSEPSAFYSVKGASSGHTFITIIKEYNGTRISQTFGFYPKDEMSSDGMTLPHPSAIKDNGGHELNARIMRTMSNEEFRAIKSKALSASTNDYNLLQYNCTNFALELYNTGLQKPIDTDILEVPYLPPLTVAVRHSPQKLFQKLKQMKDTNDPEAKNILIDQSHSTMATISKGECN